MMFLSGGLAESAGRKIRSPKFINGGARNILDLVLSDEYCGLIEEKIADNCRIASCKNDERVHLTDHETFIPEGAICRLKCKGAKATRCRCCSSGFAIGRKCPEEGDEDNCNLKMDVNALYEGPNAVLFQTTDWRGCYNECVRREHSCKAASFVKLRYNAVCWIFEEVTTRYGDDYEEYDNYDDEQSGGPTRELTMHRSLSIDAADNDPMTPLTNPAKSTKIQHKSAYQIPGYMQPWDSTSSDLPIKILRNGFREQSRTPVFGVPIAKGDAVDSHANVVDEPSMRSWIRTCEDNFF